MKNSQIADITAIAGNLKFNANCQEHRVAWKIGPVQSGGTWFGPKQKPMLDAAVASANLIHGAGTHWVESRAA